MIDTLSNSQTLPQNLPAYINVNNQNVNDNTAQADPLLCLFTRHIENAHTTGHWTWEHAHDDRWKKMFYTHLTQGANNAPPLTHAEAIEYSSQLNTALPKEGFFPAPHIMYKNLALIRHLTKTHNPLPPHLHETSTLCVPNENYATAACDQPAGTFLGFYMGWVVSPSCPPSPHHTFRIRTPREHCDISGWDDNASSATRHKTFPLSHINEYLWEKDNKPNGNNLRANNMGGLYSRHFIRRGMELTLGHGLYEYDWTHYKRKLLSQALSRVQLICELQHHTSYAHQVQTLHANFDTLTASQYASLSTLSGPLYALWEIVEGTTEPPMHGSLLIHDMSLSSFMHQLGGVQEFVDSSAFRRAHHPDRRHSTHFHWPRLIQAAQQAHKDRYAPSPDVRRSSRLRLPGPSSTYHAPTSMTNTSTSVHSNTITVSLPHHDVLTSLEIYKHMGTSPPQPISVVNSDTAQTLHLPVHKYHNTVTVILHDGTLHHPTTYVLLGDIIGEAAILPIPFALLTWTALCQSDVFIHRNDKCVTINDSADNTIARLPGTAPLYALVHIPTLLRQLASRPPPPCIPSLHASQHLRHNPSCPVPPIQQPLPSLNPTTRGLASDADSCASEDDSVDDIPEIDMIQEYAMPIPLHSESHSRL